MCDGKRLLLVDDNRDILRSMSLRFGAAGFAVQTESDSARAVPTALAEQPDAIVLDLRMPAPDGFAVLEQLRQKSEARQIPVVVVSANVVEQSRRRALDLGARYFIEKPYQPATLLRAVESAIADNASRA